MNGLMSPKLWNVFCLFKMITRPLMLELLCIILLAGANFFNLI